MALIIQLLWISFIFVQGFLATATLILCKKKKPTTPAPGSSITPQLELDKTQDQTGEQPAAGSGTTSKTGAPGKSLVKTDQKAPEDTDLRSIPVEKNKNEPATAATAATAAAPPAAEEEVKPMSAMIQAGNDNKFISKGNGVFVDKDGNPISQLAQPPQKDDAPIG